MLVCLWSALNAACVHASAVIPVRVDTRVELLAIVFRLAGSPEYNMSNSQSPYAAEVARYFGPFKDHAVVKLAAELRRTHGISFDAVMSYAVHLKNNGNRIEPVVPFESVPNSLERRWKPDDARRFLAALRLFVADTRADRFFAEHRSFYRKAEERPAVELTKRPYRTWLDSFFGAKPTADFTAIVGLLNGGANYGVAARYPGGKEDIVSVIGVSEFDSGGLPVFGQETTSLIVHEFCHSYTNPLVDRFAEKLLPAGERLFPYRKALMERQAYSDAKSMLYESMVRACVVRFAMDNETPENAKRELMEEQTCGFVWMPELVALLGEYTRQRSKYATLGSFMPEVAGFFARTADSIETLMAKLPRIVSLSPADKDQQVDPATTELRIEFDRSMQTTSFAIVGNSADVPPAAVTPDGPAKPRFVENGKVFLLPIKLEPGKTYRFSINGLYRIGFQSTDGRFLDPVQVTFTTASR